MRLPDLFIAGAAKAGTTALDEFLRQHPQIEMSPHREPNYFAFPGRRPNLRGPGGRPAPINQTSIVDFDTYASLFAGIPEDVVAGETSPVYMYMAGTAGRIASRIPHARIVVILRDPVERAISSYGHLLREGREPLDLLPALHAEPRRIAQNWGILWRYVDVGRYARQLREYLRHFDSDRILLLEHGQFSREPAVVCQKVFRFIGVADDFVPDTTVRYNVSGVPRHRWLHDLFNPPPVVRHRIWRLVPRGLRDPLRRFHAKITAGNLERHEVSGEARERLRETFEPEVEELQALIGWDLSHWASSGP